MNFQIGDRVRHRTSGEQGIVISGESSGYYLISAGFDRHVKVHESELEPAPEMELASTSHHLRILIDGESQTVAAVQQRGDGLVVVGRDGVQFVRRHEAADPAEFDRLVVALRAPSDAR